MLKLYTLSTKKEQEGQKWKQTGSTCFPETVLKEETLPI